MPHDRMLRWFESDHLPPHLASVVSKFRELAEFVVETTAPGPERTVALRKLVESKDCAVRAVLESQTA